MADAPLNYPPLPAELTPLERQAASERYWGKPDLRTAFENGAVWAEGRARSAMNAYLAGYVLADRAARATPSPPVAAAPATPVAPAEWGISPFLSRATPVPARPWFERIWKEVNLNDMPYSGSSLLRFAHAVFDAASRTAQPQPQPAQPLTGTAAKVRAPLSDAQIEKLREATFSTSNPFCPCDSKTMRKAVWAAERAHGITAPSTPTPPEVAP